MVDKELNLLTLSFKRKKNSSLIDDEKHQQHRIEPKTGLEEQYRAGFRPNLALSQYIDANCSSGSSSDEQNEETYPLNRFKRDVVLCLLIQGKISLEIWFQYQCSVLLFIAVCLLLSFNMESLGCFLACFVVSAVFLGILAFSKHTWVLTFIY